MSKLPKLSGHETIKALSNLGFVKKRQKGSHVMLVKKTNEGGNNRFLKKNMLLPHIWM